MESPIKQFSVEEPPAIVPVRCQKTSPEKPQLCLSDLAAVQSTSARSKPILSSARLDIKSVKSKVESFNPYYKPKFTPSSSQSKPAPRGIAVKRKSQKSSEQRAIDRKLARLTDEIKTIDSKLSIPKPPTSQRQFQVVSQSYQVFNTSKPESHDQSRGYS